MDRRKFEVHGEDASGDLWVVATNRLDVAETTAKRFRDDGLKNVQIIENSDVNSN